MSRFVLPPAVRKWVDDSELEKLDGMSWDEAQEYKQANLNKWIAYSAARNVAER